MQIPKCNPNVYRKAAKRIAEGEDQFSCLAISACLNSHLEFYRDQYEAVFGPHKNCKFILDGYYADLYGDHFYKKNNTHPFWDKEPTPETQEQRILALLFMAEMCENP